MELGHVVATRAIAARMEADEDFAHGIVVAIVRHRTGDSGELDAEDRKMNDWARVNGERVLSAYTVEGERVWIITEWDRSVTTILHPEDY